MTAPVPSAPVLALDVGGTKLAAAVVGPDGRVRARARRPTPGVPDAEAALAALNGLADAVLREAGSPEIGGVGMGCGGPMTWPAGDVSPLNLPAWRGFPLRARVAERFPGVPVRLHNDAICVAVGEHWRGAGSGAPDLLGMVVSTGVGGGLVLGDRLVDGETGNAGHVGHVVVDPDGPACGCGARGCLEAIARGPALAAWAHAQGWQPGNPSASARDLADAARQGYPVGVAAFERAGRAIAVALSSVAALLDLRLVVIGGGVSGAGPLLFDPLRAELRARARLPFTAALRVEPAALAGDAGLVGAAALVLAGDRYWSAG